MKTLARLMTIVVALFIALAAKAQQPASSATTAATPAQKNIEAYLRNLYAFGPDVKVVVGAAS